ncbi:MAG TPA: winged helix-turn-helix domain-containing protein [Candidatus Dormibacteraeota bacterium]|nr:winged helix-turn-helix domain-containing protein [Candidatus Dormibacteraeota bacterium]
MNETYRLDRCCVYAEERVLRCGDDIVPLPPKALDVLVALLERRGGVVSKTALMDAVWGHAGIEESNLTQSIYQLRRALQRWDPAVRIETVPRRGYRLVDGAPTGEPRVAAGGRWSRWLAGGLVVAVVVVSAGAAWWHLSRRPPAGVPPSYAMGYYYWSNAKDIADDERAIAYFDRAIGEEPHSALGYAGLADTYLSLAVRTAGTARMIADARSGFHAAREALAIDPSSADAHAAYGQAQSLFGDPAIALRELHRAVELDPTLVEAHTWYGELLMSQGSVRDAAVQFRAALALNGSWTEAGDNLAMLAYLRRDYVRSRAYASQSLAQSPGDRGAAFVLALADGQLDRRKAERELIALEQAGSRRDVAVSALLSYYESEDRDWPQASAALDRAERAVREQGSVSDPSAIVSLAAALAVRHESATALAWLARIDVPSRRLFANDPRLDALRGDPLFARWLHAT